MEEQNKVVEETTQETKETVFDSAGDDTVAKVDFNKPPTPKKENETKEDNLDDKGVDPVDDNADTTEKQEEVQPEEQAQEEAPVLEEITDEEIKDEAEVLAEDIIDAAIEKQEDGKPLPENLQKVVDFMEETGGTLEDYVSLNQDFTGKDDKTVLREFYKQTKSHLDGDEIDFLIEEDFSYDEEVDEERDIKKKKIALKEQVANAKSHLDGLKSKYYEEVKAGSKLTKEQANAIDFFNRYTSESQEEENVAKQQTKAFQEKTQQVFNDKFKGFEYNIGEKKFRFNVNNTDEVKSTQSDLNNFVGKFLDKNNTMSDAKGYHKSLFTAMNADAIANHFYEQGKADAIKDTVAKSKNINTSRQSFDGGEVGGVKFKVLGESSSGYKFKIKNK